jgi:hypothetical protein
MKETEREIESRQRQSTSPVIKEEGKCGVRIKNKNKEQEQEHEQEKFQE